MDTAGTRPIPGLDPAEIADDPGDMDSLLLPA